MKSEISQLSKISKLFYSQNKEEIEDIILFGSLLRGKIEYNDIDILIVFKNGVDKDFEYNLKKELSKVFKNISLISKTKKTVYEESFNARESMLFEGYSLIDKDYIARKKGFDSLGLFIYKTKKLNNTKKTRFYYALNGRGSSKGVIGSLDAIKISDNIIAVQLSEIDNAKDFFDSWDIEYTYVPSLIPSRLAKKHIIGKS